MTATHNAGPVGTFGWVPNTSGLTSASGLNTATGGSNPDAGPNFDYQGSSVVNRFDANSYRTITRACDYFDLAAEHGDNLSAAFAGSPTRFCLISFSSDWLYPTAESRVVARALNAAAANVSFVEIASDKGHDAFLLDEPDFHRTLGGFLAGCAEHAGLA